MRGVKIKIFKKMFQMESFPVLHISCMLYTVVHRKIIFTIIVYSIHFNPQLLSISVILFMNHLINLFISAGSSDSTVKVWDIIKQYYTHNFKGSQGVVR